MKTEQAHAPSPLFLGLGILLVAILGEFTAIMLLNNHFFTYTLDDPYIHLALSENIWHGHYGINTSEFSAPSSSIFWPLLLAPVSSFVFSPLLLNLLSAILTVAVLSKILHFSFGGVAKRWSPILLSSLLVLLILGLNIVGLVFSGMEHSLQQMLVAVIALGLVVEAEEDRIAPWFLVALVLAPCVRYENMAVSLAAIGYLVMRKHYKISTLALLLLLLFIGGFSAFLDQLGLLPLPTSVVAKSRIVGDGGKLLSLLGNIVSSFSHTRGRLLGLGALGLLVYALRPQQNSKRRQLAAFASLASLLHLAAGRFGSYNRYDIYIWTFVSAMLLYLLGNQVGAVLEGEKAKRNLLIIIVLAAGLTFTASFQCIADLLTVPIASNNIYEQQYQMHRFAVDYYGKPVAVNDIGYVSYKNEQYVLDLVGLAAHDVLQIRRADRDSEWAAEVTRANNVELVMAYEDWLRDVPSDWIKMGDLHLGRKKITPARKTVAFYALSEGSRTDILAKLRTFAETLPHGARFVFAEGEARGR